MDIKLYPHQLSIVTAPETKLAIFGGVGSGKSYAAQVRLLCTHALKYKTNVLAIRRTATECEVIYADMRSKWADVIATINQGKGDITLINGSVIHVRHGWDDQRGTAHLDGLTVSAFWISQAERLPERTYRTCLERSRHTGANGQILQIVEGNPQGKNWVYEEFVAGSERKDCTATVDGLLTQWTEYRKPGSLLIQCPSADYNFVPKGFLASISHGSERHIKRYVIGQWDEYSGQVYDCFKDSVQVVDDWDIDHDKLDRSRFARVIGLDWGLRNPCAMLWALYDRKEDCYIIYRESYLNGLTAKQQGERMVSLTGSEIIDDIEADPSICNTIGVIGEGDQLTSIRDEIESVIPWRLTMADNSLDIGIETVYRYFQERRILIFKSCVNLIRELRNYRYPDDSEEKEPRTNLKEAPLKKDDHAVDALRYLVIGKGNYERYIDNTKLRGLRTKL